MELRVESKINGKELFHFLMWHTYSSVWGFVGILISICALLAFGQMCINGGEMFTKVCLILTALLFLVVQPARLYLQAQRSMENDEGYHSPISYCFDHAGIHLAQGEDTAFYAWEEVNKVISTSKIIAIYINKKKVFKLSRRDVPSYDMLKQIIRTYAVRAMIKLK